VGVVRLDVERHLGDAVEAAAEDILVDHDRSVKRFVDTLKG
jgi:hypothetical protein